MSIDIEAEITKLQIGPSDFVVITTPTILKREALDELVGIVKKVAPRLGVPLERIILTQAGMTVTVAAADEARALLGAD
jgi:ketopantoate reductase